MSTNSYPDPKLTTLLVLLSLDGVVPLYADLGLPFEDGRAFLRVLRETILENRLAWESGSGQPPALRALLLRNLQEGLGPHAARVFSRWAETLFMGDHAAQPQWSAWDIVFSNWAFGGKSEPKGLPADKREALLRSYVDKTSVDDLKAKVAELRARRLSEWDLDMYARHGYGVDEFTDPYLIIELMVKIRRLQEFWAEAGPLLSDEEMEALLSEAGELIERLGVWMPGPLQSLDELAEELS